MDVSFQYLYSQLAVSSLPTSSVPAITAILMGIPLNSSIKPTMENHAATPAIARAVINVRIPNNIHIFIGFRDHMKNIFVHAVVNPLDEDIVEKKVAKAFMKEAYLANKPNFVDYMNKHDYFGWLINDLSKPYRREIKTNITDDNYLYPVEVNIKDILDVESEFWTELKVRCEPIPDKNVIVSISEKAALMLNGSTFSKYFNNIEFNPCISDIWECGPQNELVDFESNEVWENFVEKCARHLIPSAQYKKTRFYLKGNSSDIYEVFLHKEGVDFTHVAVEYFLFDTYKSCGISSPRQLMDWEDALDDVRHSTPEILEKIWTDEKPYNALWLNRVPKEHRLRSLVEANERDLLDSMIWSCGFEENTPLPVSKSEKTASFIELLPKQADFEPHDNRQDGPIRAKHDRKFNLKWLIDCKVNIVSESQARDMIIEMTPPHPVRFLTEKTFKPMSYGMPFMIFGNRHSLQRVRDLGFKTFPEWFDESYDDESNYVQRLDAMLDSYEKFLSEDHSIEEILPALQHNFERISDRFWVMSRMVDPIRIMCDKIEQRKDSNSL